MKKHLTFILTFLIIILFFVFIILKVFTEKNVGYCIRLDDRISTCLIDVRTDNSDKYENRVEFFYEQLSKKEKKVIIIGDSYGITYVSHFEIAWIGWKDQFDYLFPNCDCVTSSVGGAGFYKQKHGFERQLDEIIEDNKDMEVSDVILVGGYNDIWDDLEKSNKNISSSIMDFKNKVIKNYPDARISYMYVAKDYNKDGRAELIKKHQELVSEICDENDIIFVEYANDILDEGDIYYNENDNNSGFHPNNKGAKKIAISIAEYLVEGKITKKEKNDE